MRDALDLLIELNGRHAEYNALLQQQNALLKRESAQQQETIERLLAAVLDSEGDTLSPERVNALLLELGLLDHAAPPRDEETEE